LPYPYTNRRLSNPIVFINKITKSFSPGKNDKEIDRKDDIVIAGPVKMAGSDENQMAEPSTLTRYRYPDK
jgi:hypothetical protein